MNSPVAAGAVSRLEQLAGSDAFTAEPRELAGYAIDGLTPAAAVRPGSAEEIAEIIRFACAERLAIVACGAGTKLGIGLPPRKYDIALDVTRLNRIAAYDPGDLTLSVEPGLPLCKLQQTLNGHGQFLPHGAPFMTRATVGGTIVSGMEGPLRQLYGTARDYVLGVEFVAGDGVAGKSGGRVVKNVTGYDIHKLMIGSLGTLAILTKINFRTFPAPQNVRGFAIHFSVVEDAAACRDKMAASRLHPLTFEILSPRVAELFEGTAAARIETNPLASGSLSRTGWTVAASFTGDDALLDRCERDFRAVAEASGAVNFLRIGDEKTPSATAAAFGRLREFAPIALESSPGCTIVKLSVLPEHLEHVLSAAKRAANDHSLPWAAMARAVGVVYVALLPETRDEKAMRCVTDATNRVHEDCARLGGHSTIPWCPSEWKRALSVWGPQRPDLPMMQKVKAVFDPQGILAPGRFVGGI